MVLILRSGQYFCNATNFDLGTVIISNGINGLLDRNIGANLWVILQRHRNADWGLIDTNSKIENDLSTHRGGVIMSKYNFCNDIILVVTNQDSMETTVSLFSEIRELHENLNN
ncbi:hypothetical protein BCU95_24680 [Vibrio splendidus]|nr:hypothetical protein BCU95_24680 [Vibrio splendidus]